MTRRELLAGVITAASLPAKPTKIDRSRISAITDEIGKTPQAAQGLSLMVFPFTFISSAYVPVASMPSWLRAFAEHQPITVMVNAVRTLTQPAAEQLLGHPASYYVTRSLVWSVVLVAVFAPFAVAKFRRS